jgi:D-alanyl-lipoteichoic acid acyltransferase DltB (MBOAT superfamily)
MNFSLYVCYFPQLVAGPIERASDFLKSINKLNNNKLNFSHVALEKIVIGFFKKVIVADRLAIYVNHTYNASNPSSLDILIAFYLFAFQIYCDFSGYCDIASGISRILGVNLTENFKQPYLSSSIKEFWSRWHITLSSWFKSYLYIPLGGSRGSSIKTSLNLFCVFLVSGIWHGANWNFLIWGALHGVYLLVEKNFSLPFKIPKLMNQLLTFHLVCFAWIFFRAESFIEALDLISSFLRFDFSSYSLGGSKVELLVGVLGVALIKLYDIAVFYNLDFGLNEFRSSFLGYWVRTGILLFFTVFGVFSQTEFLYFQF